MYSIPDDKHPMVQILRTTQELEGVRNPPEIELHSVSVNSNGNGSIRHQPLRHISFVVANIKGAAELHPC